MRVKISDMIKGANRTLLEMYIGILAWGIVCQAIGMWFTADKVIYGVSLWFGIVFALINTWHMYRSLDRALDFDEKSATKMIFKAYVLRYAAVALVLLVVMITGVMNPLVVFLAYMGLKVTAFIQPITHKLCNKLFGTEEES